MSISALSASGDFPPVPGVPVRYVPFLVQTHRTHSVAQQAKALGLSDRRAEALRAALYKAGVLHPNNRASRPRTPERVDRARRLLESGATPGEVAKAVGASIHAVQRAIEKHAGVTLGELRRGYTAEQAAEMMGVCYTTVRLWIDYGHLQARRYDSWVDRRKRKGAVGRTHWHIERDALLDFVRLRPLWMTYEPEGITDPAIRTLAQAARRECPGRWVRFSEIAETLHYGRATVTNWYRDGRWPGPDWEVIRWGKTYYLWLPPHTALPGPPLARSSWETRRKRAA